MKTWRWILVALSAGALAAACTVEDPIDEDDGLVGGGGSGATGGSPTTSTGGPASTGTGGSSTSSAPSCDSGVPGDFTNAQGQIDQVCIACIQCTQQSSCMADWSNCAQGSGQPCDQLFACEETCSDPVNGECDLNTDGVVEETGAEDDCVADCIGGFATCETMCDTNSNGSVDPNEEACWDGCLNPPGSCRGDNPTGFDQFIDAISCSVCQNCPTNCNAAANCGSG